MKQWWFKLLSSDGEVSIKRFTGFICLILIVYLTIKHGETHINIQPPLLYTIAILMSACFGLNAIIDIVKLITQAKVANTVVEQNPADGNAQDAKDILQDKKVD